MITTLIFIVGHAFIKKVKAFNKLCESKCNVVMTVNVRIKY